MSWIKRNLFFVAGAAAAVVFLGLAGFYCFSKWSLSKTAGEELTGAYDRWNAIVGMKTHPGNEQVDNIRLTREHQVKVMGVIGDVRKQFEPIPSIPAAEHIIPQDFADALRITTFRLTREASSAGVTLPAEYSFSFAAQKYRLTFTPGSLEPLSKQLGEITAICDVLFRAKINSLESVQREKVSADDIGQGDYLMPPEMAMTNDLGVLAPYQVQFHSFSGELARVLEGFANSPHGFIVKTIDVEPGQVTPAGAPVGPAYAAPVAMPRPTPAPVPQARRTGGDPFAHYLEEERRIEQQQQMQRQQVYIPPPNAPNPSGTAPRAPGVVLDEQPLKVTLVVNVVRLAPPKE